MPIIMRYDQIEELLGGPTEAERALLVACKIGEAPLQLGDGKLPPYGPPSHDRIVRADVLRYLILGGCEKWRVQGYGVSVLGAHITGRLDLSFQETKMAISLIACRFEQDFKILQSRLAMLNLCDSHLPALFALGATVQGLVVLRRVVILEGLDLTNAKIDGDIDFVDATISGDGSAALNAQGATFEGALVWRCDAICKTGNISFSAAHITNLVDDLSCWPEEGRLGLGNLIYGRITGELDVKLRLRWLAKGSYYADAFTPQPYT